ncbi:MAG: EpsI family protein [Planctomycetes bacterium]|nr:EpsI family protein [Planctomycetota bacterium]
MTALLTGMLLIVAWRSTLAAMAARWFTDAEGYYSHGPLVPLASLLAAIVIFRRRGLPAGRTAASGAAGWALFGASCLLHLLSAYAGVMFVSGFALLGAAAGLLLIAGGWPLARAYAAPVLLLAFMVPLPMHWIAGLNLALKTHAASAAVGLTGGLLGIPAVLEGSCIYLRGPGGDVRRLVVENVCSGLRSLIGLVWFASLYALVALSRGRRRLVLLAAAAPVAIGCNILRLAVLIAGARAASVACAGEGGWLHDLTAPAAFLAALGVQTALDRLLAALPSRPPSPPQTPAAPWRTRGVLLRPAAVLLAVAVLGVVASRPAAAVPQGRMARDAAPAALEVDGRVFAGCDLDTDGRTPAVLGTDDILRRRYEDGPDVVELVIVHSAGGRWAAHPPEVCLAGAGQRLLAARAWEAGEGLPAMRELITEDGGRRLCHLYVYACGGRTTCSFSAQQGLILLGGLQRRPAGAALIRLTVPAAGRDVEGARVLARRAAGRLLPGILERLN